jgi:hypothetical protein
VIYAARFIADSSPYASVVGLVDNVGASMLPSTLEGGELLGKTFIGNPGPSRYGRSAGIGLLDGYPSGFAGKEASAESRFTPARLEEEVESKEWRI